MPDLVTKLTTPFDVLPYSAEHAFRLFDLPTHHADPFDRQIIAQALAEDIAVDAHGGAFLGLANVPLQDGARAAEELEYASLLSMYADIPAVIAATGRPELIGRYVLPMRDGRLFGTFAYTERTDAFDFRCRAVRRGDGYVLDGEKCLQTGGHLADVFLTYVREESDDIQLFLVERTDPGAALAEWLRCP